MKSTALTFIVLAVSFLAFRGIASGHHGTAAFDTGKIVVLKNATVTKFIWANPHVLTMFDVQDDKGQLVHWTVETGSPEGVKLMGWTRNSMKAGDVITVYTYQSRSGDPVGAVQKIVLADGTILNPSRGGEVAPGAKKE